MPLAGKINGNHQLVFPGNSFPWNPSLGPVVLTHSCYHSEVRLSVPWYMCVCVHLKHIHVCESVSQSCPTLCPRTVANQAPPSMGFSSKSTRVGCHARLQGVFLTQGSNPGLLDYRWILYPLGHRGIPYTCIHTYLNFSCYFTIYLCLFPLVIIYSWGFVISFSRHLAL